MKKNYLYLNITFLVTCLNVYSQTAPDTTQVVNELELANTLLNPIAHLINLQYQNNFEFKVGPQDGFKYTLNIQPLIPFHLGKKWSLITRSIIPVISQIGMSDPSGKTGISDIVLNTYISPKEFPLVLGIGPSIQFPAATSRTFGTNKWATGPTVAALKQLGPVRVAVIAHHLWAGAHDESERINTSVIRPYITYVNKSRTTFGIFSEDIRNWNAETWNVSITPTIGKLAKLGKHYVDLSMGIKYYIIAPDQAPEWGIRFTVIEVIPTKVLREMMGK